MASPQTQIQIPAAQQVLQMATGFMMARCVYYAAKLGIADLLATGAKSAEQLAAATETHPDALYRTLRALAMAGVFIETEPKVFALTPLAETLRRDAPDSIRAMVLFLGDHIHASVYENMDYSLRTGQRAFDHVFGQAPFEYITSHPEDAAIFNEAMASHSAAQIPAIVDAYDYGQFGSIADIGGGHGHLLAGILRRYPGPKGILFDLPPTIEQAKVKALPPAGRCEYVSGSFFEEIPAADAYMLKHIIHDWDDEPALRILSACRRSISENGKLLVMEMILPGMNEPGFPKLLDIEMLLIPGGRERTVQEFEALFAKAGFELTGVIPTHSPVAVIEASPV